MGIKGLSKNVIKPAARKGSLKDLPPDAKLGVDTAGWIYAAAQSNARTLRRT